jgi:hypothetical protein
MNAIRKGKQGQWAATAVQSLHTARQYVSCPECGVAALQIRDVEYGGGQRRGLDRYLLCSHCGCFRAVNLRRAGFPAEAYQIAAE